MLEEHGYAAMVDDALIVVTELVVNAALHGDGPVGLEVSSDTAGVLRISVTDSGTGVVERREPDETSGRGLMLVEALAAQWGVDQTATGKAVWATLRSR